jgi:hypothetical protein
MYEVRGPAEAKDWYKRSVLRKERVNIRAVKFQGIGHLLSLSY